MSVKKWHTKCSSKKRCLKKDQRTTNLGFSPRNIMIYFYGLSCSTGRENRFWPAVGSAVSRLSLAGGNAFPSLRQKRIWNLGKHWIKGQVWWERAFVTAGEYYFCSYESLVISYARKNFYFYKKLWSLCRSIGLCFSKVQILR